MSPGEQDNRIRKKLRGYSETPPDFDRDFAWSRLAASLPDKQKRPHKRNAALTLVAAVVLLVGAALRIGLHQSSGVDDLRSPASLAPSPAVNVERTIDTSIHAVIEKPGVQNAIPSRRPVCRKKTFPVFSLRQAPPPMRINPAFAMPAERLRIDIRPSSLYGMSEGKPIERQAFRADYFHDTSSFSKTIQKAP